MDIKVLCHSSIKIEFSNIVIYSDPFKIKEELHDADIIVITHSHYDHFSEKDILKVKNEKTKILITRDLFEKTLELGFKKEDITVVVPNKEYTVFNIKVSTIPAYNTNKKFHPKENDWVGYLLNINEKIIYIAGDTDITQESKKVNCNIALVPIGGTYTTNYEEAAELTNIILPEIVIPMHYGDIVGKKQDAILFKKLIKDNIKVNIQI